MPRLVLLLLLLLSLATSPFAARAQEKPSEALIFLVRHAERAEDGTDDPHLSAPGRERAGLLADLLRDAGITRIHTTDLHRTRETAAPLALRLGIEPEIYDAADLSAVAARLLAAPGRHLVVGHSNTTPELVRALGGEAGSSIETMEYDRLYLLVPEQGGIRTVLLRFGARTPSTP